MKTHFENSVRKLTNTPDFSISNQDFEIFLKKITDRHFQAGTFEMAVAFIVIDYYSRTQFIVESNKQEQDLSLILDAFIFAYRYITIHQSPSSLIQLKLKVLPELSRNVIRADGYPKLINKIFPLQIPMPGGSF